MTEQPGRLAFVLFAALGLVVARAQEPNPGTPASGPADPFGTHAVQVRLEHRGAIMRELEPLLMQQARHLSGEMRPWARYPDAATITRRTLAVENDIRPNAHAALGLAILCRAAPTEAFPAGLSREQARTAALALLRFLLATHGAAEIACADGKSWGNQWQSALWAATAGQACWLLWDDLSARERWLAARMISDEADRFVGQAPPAQEFADTKAEENAWNSQVISLAACMFPRHPRRAVWRETAIRWAASSFATARDLESTRLVDGRPLREWVSGANVHADHTLENHRRVHPDYMATTTQLSYQVPLYAWGGIAAPEALHHNVEAVYANEKRLSFPDGGWVYPNGQDWHLRRNGDWFNLHAAMAILYADRQAAALLRISLDTLRRMAARDPRGPITRPGETVFASTHALQLDWLAQAYLLMAERGEGPAPVPEARLWQELAGLHVSTAGKFALLRTERSVASFSWGAQVMGMVLPLRHDLLLAPNLRGLIGCVQGERPNVAPVVKRIEIAPGGADLVISGVLSRAGGALEQRFALVALPDGRVVYADQIRRVGGNGPVALNLGTLGVLNDAHWPFHDGSRTLTHAGGQRVFTAAGAAVGEPVWFDSRWYHLDGLGIVCLDVSGRQLYVPAPTDARGRLEQLFHLNSSTAERAHSVLVFHPEASIAQIRSASAATRLESAPGAEQVRLRLEDGVACEIDLARLMITITRDKGGLDDQE